MLAWSAQYMDYFLSFLLGFVGLVMASHTDDVELQRLGRPRKSELELSSRSRRRRLNEELVSLRALSSHPSVSNVPRNGNASNSGGSISWMKA